MMVKLCAAQNSVESNNGMWLLLIVAAVLMAARDNQVNRQLTEQAATAPATFRLLPRRRAAPAATCPSRK